MNKDQQQHERNKRHAESIIDKLMKISGDVRNKEKKQLWQ